MVTSTRKKTVGIVKPGMIQDDFMGDFYLGCPNCKEAIHFSVVKNPEGYKPQKCSKCGAEFDWKEVRL